MSNSTQNAEDHIPLWRATARLAGRDWTDAAYGFGGSDVAETIGTGEEIGAELTRFLGSFVQEDVEAQQMNGGFSVRVEIEPRLEGSSTLAARTAEAPAEHPVALWEASASVGNAEGIFDACYFFGNVNDDEGYLLGTAQEMGAELTRVLNMLTRQDVEDMKHGTDRFSLLLEVDVSRRTTSPVVSRVNRNPFRP
jgi:hypothetical protein